MHLGSLFLGFGSLFLRFLLFEFSCLSNRGTVPSRSPVSSSIRSVRQSSSMTVLICWMIVRSMRLHALKVSMLPVYCCLASAIWAIVPLVRSGRTGRTGRSKWTPGETCLYVRTLLTNPRCPWLPLPRMDRTDLPFALHSFLVCKTCVGRIAIDLCQRGMLEVVLAVVDLGARHCLC
jgi:hypothetical protein